MTSPDILGCNRLPAKIRRWSFSSAWSSFWRRTNIRGRWPSCELTPSLCTTATLGWTTAVHQAASNNTKSARRTNTVKMESRSARLAFLASTQRRWWWKEAHLILTFSMRFTSRASAKITHPPSQIVNGWVQWRCSSAMMSSKSLQEFLKLCFSVWCMFTFTKKSVGNMNSAPMLLCFSE